MPAPCWMSVGLGVEVPVIFVVFAEKVGTDEGSAVELAALVMVELVPHEDDDDEMAGVELLDGGAEEVGGGVCWTKPPSTP